MLNELQQYYNRGTSNFVGDTKKSYKRRRLNSHVKAYYRNKANNA